MKKTLASQQNQDWNLLDMKPMHRALLRRTVDPIVNPIVNSNDANTGAQLDRKIEFRWYHESLRSSDDHALLALLQRPGVLVVDRDAFVQRVVENRVFDPVLDALHRRSIDQIRLVWHWSLRGKQDLLWCTEMAMDGVINDPRSLALWSRVCRRKGKCYEGQSNTLLSGIRLPSLAVSNPTLT